jgi:preprotein translocase subunit YajC
MSLFPTALLAAEKSSPGGLQQASQFLLFGVIFVAMYFLLIRPQRRRAKEAQELVRAVQIGDQVQLSSGLIGFVTDFDKEDQAGDVVWVDLADGVEVRAMRSAIVRRIEVRQEAPAVESDNSDDSDK